MLKNFNFFKQEKLLTLLDQALISLVNFGAILVLAKTVSVEVFASFVVLYSYHLFVYLFSSQCMALPILVFLPKKWKNKEGAYLLFITSINTLLCLGLTLLIFYFLNKQVDNVPLLQFFLLTISMTTFNLLRRFIYSSKNIHIKFSFITSLFLNFLFFYGLFSWDTHNLSGILSVYWISFFFVDFLLLLFLFKNGIFKNSLSALKGRIISFFKEIITTHYHYAKWILLGGVAFWGYTQGIYILAEALGVSDPIIGKVRTIQNLLGVFNILAISIDNHYTPIFSERLNLPNKSKILTLLRATFLENYKKILSLFVLAVPIGLGFYHFIYSDKFGDGKVIFFTFLFIQFLVICIKPIEIVLKSIENTKTLFWGQAFGAVGMLASLLFLVYSSDYYALPVAIAVATFINLAVLSFFLRKEVKK